VRTHDPLLLLPTSPAANGSSSLWVCRAPKVFRYIGRRLFGEVYTFRFRGGRQMAVSRRSGSATGKKLFYIALDGRLMAVAIRIASTSQTIDAVSPVPLFATHVGEAFILSLQPAVRRLSRWPEVPDEPRQSSRISGRLVLPFGTPSSRCLATTLSQARSRRCWPSTRSDSYVDIVWIRTNTRR